MLLLALVACLSATGLANCFYVVGLEFSQVFNDYNLGGNCYDQIWCLSSSQHSDRCYSPAWRFRLYSPESPCSSTKVSLDEDSVMWTLEGDSIEYTYDGLVLSSPGNGYGKLSLRLPGVSQYANQFVGAVVIEYMGVNGLPFGSSWATGGTVLSSNEEHSKPMSASGSWRTEVFTFTDGVRWNAGGGPEGVMFDIKTVDDWLKGNNGVVIHASGYSELTIRGIWIYVFKLDSNF
jgi:hypothetical protein